jgi:hypothetical protein
MPVYGAGFLSPEEPWAVLLRPLQQLQRSQWRSTACMPLQQLQRSQWRGMACMVHGRALTRSCMGR